ncbi:MAG: hypothetical protein V1841_00095, partial [Patescibacteria group bacterium]
NICYDFFDDFSSNDFSKWNILENTAVICNASSGYARLGGYYSDGYKHCIIQAKNTFVANTDVLLNFQILYATECDELLTVESVEVESGEGKGLWATGRRTGFETEVHPECCHNTLYSFCCFGKCGVLISSTESYQKIITGIDGDYRLNFKGIGQWCSSGVTGNEYRLDNITIQRYALNPIDDPDDEIVVSGTEEPVPAGVLPGQVTISDTNCPDALECPGLCDCAQSELLNNQYRYSVVITPYGKKRSDGSGCTCPSSDDDCCCQPKPRNYCIDSTGETK